MSERNGSTSIGPGTAEIPVPSGASPREGQGPGPPASTSVPGRGAAPGARGRPTAPPTARRLPRSSGPQPTAPVTVRPAPRMPRRGPLTVMGPWAPVAGGLLGLVLGGIVAAVLGGTAESYDERLSLVFLVLGLGMLGTAGVLLADEVRIMRQRARDAAVRPQWVEATAACSTA